MTRNLPTFEDIDNFVTANGYAEARRLTDEAEDIFRAALDLGDATAHDADTAIATSPLCADAFAFLAERQRTPTAALPLYRLGVKAGEAYLDIASFVARNGHFWGEAETRPYMRARAGLAATLWTLGRRDEALAHMRKLLDMDPGDSMGVRYRLAAHLFELGHDSELEALLVRFEFDKATSFTYARAVLAFLKGRKSADRLLDEAMRLNPHVPGYILGQEPLLPPSLDYVTARSQAEASDFARLNMRGWHARPTVIEWLTTAA